MHALKRFWFKLPAKQKRQTVIVAGCLIGVLILWQFLSVEHRNRPEPVEASSVSLTADGTERFQLDVLVSRIREMEEEQEAFYQTMRRKEAEDKTDEQIEKMRKQHAAQINQLNERLEQQRSELANRPEAVTDATLEETIRRLEGEDAFRADNQGSQDRGEQTQKVRPRTPTDADLWGDSRRFQSTRSAEGGEQQDGKEEAETPKATITVIESEAISSESDEDAREDESIQYLPAGTIISGTLITGLDAPTNQGASSEPHPALLRVKEEAIMPNRYRGDIRECFVILGGYGSLSTERAFMRSETLSCIDGDGNAMESSLESFAVGEDASAGIRGRLVSKEGQLLAQSLKAGALGAFAEVFRSTPVPTIQTEASGTTPFQSVASADAVQSGAVAGAGDALDRIAQYYLDVADMIFPVIEISAGREIDLVVNKGTEIRFNR